MNEESDPLREYLREISHFPLLRAEKERDLALAAFAGDGAAKKALINANLRLVVSIARRYSDRGPPLLDIIQEGNIGLVRAVERFDGREGVKFMTFATPLIREAIEAAFK